jgi:hypothetical protein
MTVSIEITTPELARALAWDMEFVLRDSSRTLPGATTTVPVREIVAGDEVYGFLADADNGFLWGVSEIPGGEPKLIDYKIGAASDDAIDAGARDVIAATLLRSHEQYAN